MKKLNLAYPETSDIKFEVSHFPDGQQDVRILDPFDGLDPTTIISRLTSFKDVELILCATKALRRLHTKEIHLYIPYLIGARSDRQFIKGGTSYLHDVLAPIINAEKYESVTVLDPHSDVASACIDNLEALDNNELLRFALSELYQPNTPDNFVLVSPDAGSLKKIYNAAAKIGFDGEYVICSKYRNFRGDLSRIEAPVKEHNIHRDHIIIDDICDGGRTFIEIAKAIKTSHPHFDGKIYLVITHGIFSNGFGELSEHIDKIFCTNSYKDLDPHDVTTNSVKSFKTSLMVKQLNVF